MQQALSGCVPAHLLHAHSTVEGTPAFFDYFVVERQNGCRVVVFADFTADYWGRCKLRRTECPNLEAADSDDPEANGCSPVETLYEAGVCKNPYQ
jgi:hypothetical protein